MFAHSRTKKKTVTTDHTQRMICGQRLLPCRNDVAGRKELPYNRAYTGRFFLTTRHFSKKDVRVTQFRFVPYL